MKIIGKIFAILYCIIFTVLLFALSFVLSSTNFFKGSYYLDIIKSININEISAKALGLSDNPNDTIEDVLINFLKDNGINKKVSEVILNNEVVKEVFGNTTEDIINYIIKPEKMPSISEKDVEKIMNNKEIKELIGNDIKREDIDKTVNLINDFLNDNLQKVVKK